MNELEQLCAEVAALKKQAQDDDLIIMRLLEMIEASIGLVRKAVLSDKSPDPNPETQALVDRWERLLAAIAAGRAAALLTNAPTSKASN